MDEAEHQERQHLAEADRHIADGERHVTEQTMLIERLRASGGDVAAAEAVRDTFEEVVAQHRAHRELILARLDQLGAGPPGCGKAAEAART